MHQNQKNELEGLRVNEEALEKSITTHKAQKDAEARSKTTAEEMERLRQIRARINELGGVKAASVPKPHRGKPAVS